MGLHTPTDEAGPLPAPTTPTTAAARDGESGAATLADNPFLLKDGKVRHLSSPTEGDQAPQSAAGCQAKQPRRARACR